MKDFFVFQLLFVFLHISHMELESMGMEEVIAHILEGSCTPQNDFFTSKKEEHTLIRYFAWYYCHCKLGITICSIAKRFSCTTRNVYYGIAKIRYGLETQRFYRDISKRIEAWVANKTTHADD